MNAATTYAHPSHGHYAQVDSHHMAPPQMYPGYQHHSASMLPQHVSSYPAHHAPHHHYPYSAHVAPPQLPSQYQSYAGAQAPQHTMTLPAISSAPQTSAGPSAVAEYAQRPMDTTGQTGPPNAKPKVTATLWEDEGTLCFQVEAEGICVARRQDNHMINGTKLLNVARMTRGRRDGILKSEKSRKVIKIGPMHLKGVWITYERALEFANKEKITELLYPLFVHDIDSLLTVQPGASSVPAGLPSTARDARAAHAKESQSARGSQPPAGLPSHHSLPSSAPQTSAAQTISSTSARPGLDRAHTYPTPPSNASGALAVGGSSSSYEYGSAPSTALNQQQPFADSKSLPTSPATSPPLSNISQQYQGYEATRSAYPAQQNNYAVPPANYGYGKTDMGPPLRSSRDGEIDHSYDHDRYGYHPTLASSSHLDHPSSAKTSPQTVGGQSTPHSVGDTPQSQWPGSYTPHRSQTLPSTSLSYSGPHAVASTNGYGQSLSHSYDNYNAVLPSNKRSRDDDDDGSDDPTAKRMKSAATDIRYRPTAHAR